MRLRSLLFGLLLLLAGFASGTTNAIILIQHDAAGPNLPSADYIHGEWIRWPVDEGGGRNNRILALMTGYDLQGFPEDEKFASQGDGRVSRNGASLAARGIFEARKALLGGADTFSLAKKNGGISPSVLLLALPDGKAALRPLSFDSPLPDGLVFYEATNADDKQAVLNRVDGRAIVIEYPPAGEEGWSRYWFYGKDWPSGVPTARDPGIPGLIRARDVISLLLRPERFSWQASTAGRWGGANRWLEHGETVAFGVLVSWFSLAAFIVVWAFAQVMNEDRGPFVSQLLVSVALSPAAITLAGAMARYAGLDAWPIWMGLASLILYGLSLLSGLLARHEWPEIHPLWATSMVGLAAMVAFDPAWSDLSNRFGRFDVDVPGAALGVAAAYLTGMVALAPTRWFGRGVVLAALLWGVTGRPWWADGHGTLLILPAAILAASEGLVRPVTLAVLVFLPTGLWRLVQDGVIWAPENLLPAVGNAKALNAWYYAAFTISPGWAGTFFLMAAGLLLGTRFLAYRLAKLLRMDPRLRVFPWMVAVTMALGLAEPLALPAVPVVVFAGLIVLAYDGLRANA